MKNKKGEIGTIVMMALLVIVSLIGFSSQKFLSLKKTISTQAAANRLCCLKYGCGLYGASAEQRKVTAIGFEGVNAQGTAGYTSCLNTGYTGSFYCDSLSGAPTTNGTSTYVTSADCTTSSTPTPAPTQIPNTCSSNGGECRYTSDCNVVAAGVGYCINLLNSSWTCCKKAASVTNTPTPTQIPTPIIVNSPLPTSSGTGCAIIAHSYSCGSSTSKTFFPSQKIGLCPENSPCWGIDNNSCNQTYIEVRDKLCDYQLSTGCTIIAHGYSCDGSNNHFYPSQKIGLCPENSSCWGIDNNSCNQTYTEVKNQLCNSQQQNPTGSTPTRMPTPTMRLDKCTLRTCQHITNYKDMNYWEKCIGTTDTCGYFSDEDCGKSITKNINNWCSDTDKREEVIKTITINTTVEVSEDVKITYFDIENPEVIIIIYGNGEITRKTYYHLNFPITFSYTAQNTSPFTWISPNVEIRTNQWYNRHKSFYPPESLQCGEGCDHLDFPVIIK